MGSGSWTESPPSVQSSPVLEPFSILGGTGCCCAGIGDGPIHFMDPLRRARRQRPRSTVALPAPSAGQTVAQRSTHDQARGGRPVACTSYWRESRARCGNTQATAVNVAGVWLVPRQLLGASRSWMGGDKFPVVTRHPSTIAWRPDGVPSRRAHTLLPLWWFHGAALLWHGRYRQAPSLPPWPLKRQPRFPSPSGKDHCRPACVCDPGWRNAVAVAVATEGT